MMLLVILGFVWAFAIVGAIWVCAICGIVEA